MISPRSSQTPILITGAPRAGIGLFATLLGLGCRTAVYDFADVLGDILEATGHDREGLRALPPLDEIRGGIDGLGSERAQAHFRELFDQLLVARGRAPQDAWIVADHRLALLWPIFRKVYPEARWVLVARHPSDMMRSLKETLAGKIKDDEAVAAIVAYGERLEALQADIPFDCYHEAIGDALAKGDWTHVEHLADRLGLVMQASARELYDRALWKGTADGRVPFNVAINVNVPFETIAANIRFALTRTALPLIPAPAVNNGTMILVGGGPSLARQLPVLRRLAAKRGHFIMALNGAHNWLLERGVVPWACCIMDARPENEKFVERARKGIVYFIASQCDPAVWKRMLFAQVVRWHVHAGRGEDRILREAGSPELLVTGGCTVATRATVIGLMLGFRRFAYFGHDSCYAVTGEHHAYAQTWNDGEGVKIVELDGKRFTCSGWQAQQVEEFKRIWEAWPEIDTSIHGGGLLATMHNVYLKERGHGGRTRSDAGFRDVPDSGPGPDAERRPTYLS